MINKDDLSYSHENRVLSEIENAISDIEDMREGIDKKLIYISKLLNNLKHHTLIRRAEDNEQQQQKGCGTQTL